jgi:hypothetical protein
VSGTSGHSVAYTLNEFAWVIFIFEGVLNSGTHTTDLPD